MTYVDVARAWKDSGYRSSLTAEELSMVPANPAGMVELSDEDLVPVLGAAGGAEPDSLTVTISSAPCVEGASIVIISIYSKIKLGC